MLTRPPRHCARCNGPCKVHAPRPYSERPVKRIETRASAYRRGYDGRWQRSRLAFLLDNPRCVVCNGPANEVDHIVPHKGDCDVFWDMDNWQSLCGTCHKRKTGRGE